MYTYKLVPFDESKPVIDRSMSSNCELELLPILCAICKQEYNWPNPVALSMGNRVYRIFDANNPNEYALVSIVKDAN